MATTFKGNKDIVSMQTVENKFNELASKKTPDFEERPSFAKNYARAQFLQQCADAIYYGKDSNGNAIDPRNEACKDLLSTCMAELYGGDEQFYKSNYNQYMKALTGYDIDAKSAWEIFKDKTVEGFSNIFNVAIPNLYYMFDTEFGGHTEIEKQRLKEEYDKKIAEGMKNRRTDYYKEFDSLFDQLLLSTGSFLPSMLPSIGINLVGAVLSPFTGGLSSAIAVKTSAVWSALSEWASAALEMRQMGASDRVALGFSSIYGLVAGVIENYAGEFMQSTMFRGLKEAGALHSKVYNTLEKGTLARTIKETLSKAGLEYASSYITEPTEEMLQDFAQNLVTNWANAYQKKYGKPFTDQKTLGEMVESMVNVGIETLKGNILLGVGTNVAQFTSSSVYGEISKIRQARKTAGKDFVLNNNTELTFVDNLRFDPKAKATSVKNGEGVGNIKGYKLDDNSYIIPSEYAGKAQYVKKESNNRRGYGVYIDVLEDISTEGLTAMTEFETGLATKDVGFAIGDDARIDGNTIHVPEKNFVQAIQSIAFSEKSDFKGIATNKDGSVTIQLGDKYLTVDTKMNGGIAFGEFISQNLPKEQEKYENNRKIREIQDLSEKTLKSFTKGEAKQAFDNAFESGNAGLSEENIKANNESKDEYINKFMDTYYESTGTKSEKKARAFANASLIVAQRMSKALGQNIKQFLSDVDFGVLAEGQDEYKDAEGKDKIIRGKFMGRVIKLSQYADATTLIHEMSHLFLDKVGVKYGDIKGFKEVYKDQLKLDNTTKNADGTETVKDEKDWVVGKETQEAFAHDFERYVRENVVANSAMKKVFDQLKACLVGIRNSLKGQLSEEAKKMFDDLLGDAVLEQNAIDNGVLKENETLNSEDVLDGFSDFSNIVSDKEKWKDKKVEDFYKEYKNDILRLFESYPTFSINGLDIVSGILAENEMPLMKEYYAGQLYQQITGEKIKLLPRYINSIIRNVFGVDLKQGSTGDSFYIIDGKGRLIDFKLTNNNQLVKQINKGLIISDEVFAVVKNGITLESLKTTRAGKIKLADDKSVMIVNLTDSEIFEIKMGANNAPKVLPHTGTKPAVQGSALNNASLQDSYYYNALKTVNEEEPLPFSEYNKFSAGGYDKLLSDDYASPDDYEAQIQYNETLTQLKSNPKNWDGTNWLAPNGKVSKLTERQYVQVRTPNFKAWFGDWENDPENASKIVDKNGEPLVVYHHTNDASFEVFRIGTGNYYVNGLYFMENESKSGYGDEYIASFLNIRNPNDVGKNQVLDTDKKAEFIQRFRNWLIPYMKISARINDNLFDYGYDGVINWLNSIEDRLDRGGTPSDILKAATSFANHIYLNERGKKLIDRWVRDVNSSFYRATGIDGFTIPYKGWYVALQSNQVKSATGNTGEFSNENPNIYHSEDYADSTWYSDMAGRAVETLQKGGFLTPYQLETLTATAQQRNELAKWLGVEEDHVIEALVNTEETIISFFKNAPELTDLAKTVTSEYLENKGLVAEQLSPADWDAIGKEWKKQIEKFDIDREGNENLYEGWTVKRIHDYHNMGNAEAQLNEWLGQFRGKKGNTFLKKFVNDLQHNTTYLSDLNFASIDETEGIQFPYLSFMAYQLRTGQRVSQDIQNGAKQEVLDNARFFRDEWLRWNNMGEQADLEMQQQENEISENEQRRRLDAYLFDPDVDVETKKEIKSNSFTYENVIRIIENYKNTKKTLARKLNTLDSRIKYLKGQLDSNKIALEIEKTDNEVLRETQKELLKQLKEANNERTNLLSNIVSLAKRNAALDMQHYLDMQRRRIEKLASTANKKGDARTQATLSRINTLLEKGGVLYDSEFTPDYVKLYAPMTIQYMIDEGIILDKTGEILVPYKNLTADMQNELIRYFKEDSEDAYESRTEEYKKNKNEIHKTAKKAQKQFSNVEITDEEVNAFMENHNKKVEKDENKINFEEAKDILISRKIGNVTNKGSIENKNIKMNLVNNPLNLWFTNPYEWLGQISTELRDFIFGKKDENGNDIYYGLNQAREASLKNQRERHEEIAIRSAEVLGIKAKSTDKLVKKVAEKFTDFLKPMGALSEVKDTTVAIDTYLDENQKETAKNLAEYQNPDNNDTYTKEDFMGIYIRTKNNVGLTHLVRGNNISVAKAMWVREQFETNPEFAEMKAIADILIDVIGNRFNDVADVAYKVENIRMVREPNYYPNTTLDHRISLDIATNSYNKDPKLTNYFTKAVLDGTTHVSLSVITDMDYNIRAQEEYIAGAQMFKDFDTLLNGEDKLLDKISAQYGEKVAKAITEFININKNRVNGDLAEVGHVIGVLRSNYSMAKLAFNLSSVLQQPASLFLALQKYNGAQIARAIARVARGGRSYIMENVYGKSEQMRQRSQLEIGYAKDMRASASKLSKAKRAFAEAATFAMEKVDHAIAAILFDCAYQEALASGVSEETASIEATQWVLNIQSSTDPKNNALAYSSKNDLLKLWLMFTNQLNKQYNMAVSAVYSKDARQIVGTLAGLALSTIWVCLVTGKFFTDDDDDDEKWKNWLSAVSTESLGMLPLIGSGAAGIKGVLEGYYYQNNNSTMGLDAFNKLVQAISVTSEKDPVKRKKKLGTALKNLAYSVEDFAGLPSVQTKRVVQGIEMRLDGKSVIQSISPLFGREWKEWVEGK